MLRKSTHILCTLVALVLAGSTSICFAQVKDLVGVLYLTADAKVADQLELSEKVRGQLKELFAEFEDKYQEDILDAAKLPPGERTLKLAPIVEEARKRGQRLMTAKQWELLEKIDTVRSGLVSLGQFDIANQFELTDEQKQAVAELLDEREAAIKAAAGPDAERVVAGEFERKLNALLTDDQRAQWQTLVDSTKPDDAAPVTVKTEPKTETNLEPAKTSPKTGPRSFGTRTPPPIDEGPRKPATSLKFKFRYQPWKDVLDWFADQAGLSLFVSETMPVGTFNYTDDRSYTPEQALDLLNGALLTKGFTLVRREKMLMVVNLEDGVPPNLVPYVGKTEIDKRGEFELISVVFKLDKMAPADAEGEIRKLLGPQGNVVVLPKARQIMVTETAGRMKTIRDVIQAIESPQEETRMQVFSLEHAMLMDAMPIVRQMLDIPADRNVSGDGAIRVAEDVLGNRILATGSDDALKRVSEIVKVIDVQSTANTGDTVYEAPQLEVHKVSKAEPEMVRKVIETMLAGQPDVRLDIDPKTGNLVALCRPSQHRTIKATIEQMERDGQRIEVFQLRTLDPALAVLSINKLFGNTGETPNPNAPTVDAIDPTSGTLIARGTDGQITQIRELLDKLTGGEASATTTARSNVRMLPLTGRQTQSALQQLESIWPALHKNKIRIVTPSEQLSPIDPEATDAESILRSLPPIPSRTPAETYQPKPKPQADPQPTAAPPRQPAPRRTTEDRTTKVDRHPSVRLRFAVQTVKPPVTAQEPATLRQPSEQQPPRRQPPQPPVRQPEPQHPVAQTPATAPPNATEPKSVPGAPIIVVPGRHGVIIASEDLDALDRFEALLKEATGSTFTSGNDFTVFYLKYTNATQVAETIEQIFSGGTTSSAGGGGGSLLGDIAGSMMGDMGGLFGGLLGGGGGGSALSSSSVMIVPDTRLNALIVQAAPAELDLMEDLLRVIDSPHTPETDVAAKPRMIPVKHTSADEIANVVRQVFADRISGSGGQPRQPSPEEFIRALRGGGRGGSRGGSRGGGAAEPTKMTVGVDSRSNALIVSAPQELFDEVKALVEKLDQAAVLTDESMEIVTLTRANPQSVSQALSAILGQQVKTSAAGQAATSSAQNGSSTSNSNSPSTRSSDQNRNPLDEMRQRFEMFRQLQGGGSSRGGFGRGGSGGGTPAGGFGGSGRGGFGGGSSRGGSSRGR